MKQRLCGVDICAGAARKGMSRGKTIENVEKNQVQTELYSMMKDEGGLLYFLLGHCGSKQSTQNENLSRIHSRLITRTLVNSVAGT